MNVFCWLGWNAPSTVIASARAPRGRARSAAGAPGARRRAPARAQRRPHRLVAERAERDDHAHAGRAARARGRGTARTRRARPASACSPAARSAPRRRRTRRAARGRRRRATDVGWFAKPHAVQRREQEVARAVAGEHAAGAVAAVRGRREPDDQHPGAAGRRSRAPAGPSTSSSRNDARFSRATCSRHATSRGHARHADDLGARARRDRVRGAGHECGCLRRADRYPPRPMRVLLLVNATASSVTPRKRVHDPQDARGAARRRGRGDVAPRARDPARARRRRTTASTSSRCSPATARSTKRPTVCCTPTPRSRRCPADRRTCTRGRSAIPRDADRRGERAARVARTRRDDQARRRRHGRTAGRSCSTPASASTPR